MFIFISQTDAFSKTLRPLTNLSVSEIHFQSEKDTKILLGKTEFGLSVIIFLI